MVVYKCGLDINCPVSDVDCNGLCPVGVGVYNSRCFVNDVDSSGGCCVGVGVL